MAAQSQSPSPDTGKSASPKRPPRPPLAQALKKAIQSVQSTDDVGNGPTGQSPLRRAPKKTTNALQ